MLRWLYFPPFASIFLLLFVALLHNRTAAQHLPAVMLGGMIAVYLCLCAVSGFFISKRDGQFLWGIFALAQGVLLMTMSLHVGATFLAWIGLLLLLVGLIVSFFHTTGGKRALHDVAEDTVSVAQQNALERERTESLLAKLPLPICIADSKGSVLGATPSFFNAIGKEPGEIEGLGVGEFLPLDRDEVTLESGTWWIEQINEGSRHYFSLLPTKDCKPVKQASPSASLQAAAGLSIQDPGTGLYSDEYRKLRGPEEVARAQRYRRSLSGLVLELDFAPSDKAGLSDQHKTMLFNAFAQKVQSILRTMDCGFLTPTKHRIQVLLPETPVAGAKTLLSRLVMIPQDVFDADIREAVNPRVKNGIFFFNGTPPMDYNVFCAALEESIMKSQKDKDAGKNAA